MEERKDKKNLKLLLIVFVVLLVMALFPKDRATEETPIAVEESSGAQAAVGESSGPSATAEGSTKEHADYIEYTFANEDRLNEHFEKHGVAMGFESAAEYEKAASDVVNDPMSLHKIEAEDGDDVYYLESSNELVIVSTRGYIRTYFLPDDGKAYFDRT